MKPKAMIVLVGEQPAPNLLPVRHIKPDQLALIYTSRTESVANNLVGILSAKIECNICLVDPYQIGEILTELSSFIEANFNGCDLLFNLTGGTKPMALAAFQIARSSRSPFCYFQSEGNQSLLFRYEFGSTDAEAIREQGSETIPTSICLDDYLRMYWGTYSVEPPRDEFEQQVINVLQSTPGVDEIFTSLRPQGMEALEIDFFIRCGNQVGIGEVKSNAKKSAIDS